MSQLTNAVTNFQLVFLGNKRLQDFLLNLTVLDRAYKLCSTYLNFIDEIEVIRKYFGQNGYPFDMVEKCIKTKFDSLFIPRIHSTDVPFKKIYATLPYVSEFSNEVKVELTKLLHRLYSQRDIVLIFKKIILPLAIFSSFKDVIQQGSK